MGKLSKRTLSGALGTETATPRDNVRPSAVQTAPATHEVVDGRDILTSSLLFGVTVISHRLRRPSTCRALVTVPSVTISACCIAASVVLIGSLNASCRVNAVEPSCSSGTSLKRAISGTKMISASADA